MRLPTLLLTGVFASLPFLYAQPVPTFEADWLPVTDAERQLKTAKVEKDAGAGALFWRVRV
jgi:hypothetical protein